MNLSLTNISKKFGKTTVLTGLNLEIETGKVVAILGSSGCGKSTLLNIIAGFERCNSGKVKVNDKVLSDQEEKVFTCLSIETSVIYFKTLLFSPT